jgi:hypothetical protein
MNTQTSFNVNRGGSKASFDSAKLACLNITLCLLSSTFGEAIRSYDEGLGTKSPKPIVVKRDRVPGQYILPKSKLFEALRAFCQGHSELRVTAIHDDYSIPGGVAIDTQKKTGAATRTSVVLLNAADSRDGVIATYPMGDKTLAVVERPK